MNYARKIANMLGLEIGEKFRIKGHPDMGTFWFVDDQSMGLRDIWDYDLGKELYDCFDDVNGILEQILTGFYEVEKLPWKPKKDNEYWFYSISDGCPHIGNWRDFTADLMFWKTGNCFRTREEAETKGKELVEQIRKEYEEA